MRNFMHNATILNEPASPALGKGGEAVLKRIRNDDTRSLTKKPNPREFNHPADSVLGCGSVSKAPLMRNRALLNHNQRVLCTLFAEGGP